MRVDEEWIEMNRFCVCAYFYDIIEEQASDEKQNKRKGAASKNNFLMDVK